MSKEQATIAPIILWFRKDLRLSDHPALHAAQKTGAPIIGVFIKDEFVDALGAAAKLRLEMSLKAFAKEITAIGGRLIFREGKSQDVLTQLTAQTGAQAIYWSRAYVPSEQARDAQIKEHFHKQGVTAKSFGGFLLVEPWDVATKAGGYFKVYTPFWRAVRGRDFPQVLPNLTKWNAFNGDLQSDRLADWRLARAMQKGQLIVRARQDAGHIAAQRRLHDFVDEKIAAYNDTRDFPAKDGTSNLSDALALGEVSPLMCWRAGMRAFENGAAGAEQYLKELVWREFAYHLVHYTPHILTQNWRPEWDNFPWREDADAEDVLRWKQGRTGVPLVDAAMRQMFVTGRMHNRARMIVASYLTKHMGVHWRVGQNWFAECLTDWDPAANAMGWQWVAGCGPDASPFFRIFNPVGQAEKFDKDRAYTRHWLAEGQKNPSADALAFFEAAPQSWGICPSDPYPQEPIVDLAKGRAAALLAYDVMKTAS